MSDLSKQFGDFCLKNNIVIVTAESCTAGLIAGTIAQTPGSSSWLEAGYVVYTAKAKELMLGVKPETIQKYDITSVQVSDEMALGALNKSTANVAMSVTGVAGPGGGTLEIPVGTVCMSWSFKDKQNQVESYSEKVFFKGERNEIRENVVEYMLKKCMVYGGK